MNDMPRALTVAGNNIGLGIIIGCMWIAGALSGSNYLYASAGILTTIAIAGQMR